MKQSLLEIVQDILSELNSFSANSISETVESEQVATIVRKVFYEMVTQRSWAHTKRTIQLNSATAERPTHLSVPEHVKEVQRILYDVRKAADERLKYQEIQYLTPEQFLCMQNGLDSTASNVDTVQDTGGITLLVRNDKQPQYWTSFDDQYVVMDSYYSTLDSFLQNSKTQALVLQLPVWTHEDDFYPDLPEEAFAYLCAESLSRASYTLRGTAHEKAEQSSNRLRRYLSQNGWKLNSGDRVRTYGRFPETSKKLPLEK